jgi:hypothetical protein
MCKLQRRGIPCIEVEVINHICQIQETWKDLHQLLMSWDSKKTKPLMGAKIIQWHTYFSELNRDANNNAGP